MWLFYLALLLAVSLLLTRLRIAAYRRRAPAVARRAAPSRLPRR